MSGVNTKASKIDRILARQMDLCELVEVVSLQNLTAIDQTAAIDRLSNSLKLATETAHRLESENARLRSYLGSLLFERRKLDVKYPVMEPRFANRVGGQQCGCAPGVCRDPVAPTCRHPTPQHKCRCTGGFCRALVQPEFAGICKGAKRTYPA